DQSAMWALVESLAEVNYTTLMYPPPQKMSIVSVSRRSPRSSGPANLSFLLLAPVRLRFRKTQRHVTAYVEAVGSGGKAVISASTQEWAIKKHLSSTRDVAAAQNVGRVLAQRCLEAGIAYLTFRAIPWEYRAESVQRFRSAMKDGGVILSEPQRVHQ
ncbi:hypothetical protein scyTo_0022513, partial [Scyliorhinus torazame]|nr:hypothetical protein [Scyliorhinus torazame]